MFIAAAFAKPASQLLERLDLAPQPRLVGLAGHFCRERTMEPVQRLQTDHIHCQHCRPPMRHDHGRLECEHC